MTQKISFGALFKQFRKAYKYNCTQAELAEKLGYSVETIRSWELGRRFPADDEVPRLAQIMELGPEEVRGAIQLGRVRLGSHSTFEKTALVHDDLSIADGVQFLESDQENGIM